MQQNISTVYGLWSGLVLLLGAQALWSLFFAYPAGSERMLRRGRSWVYIPLGWSGFRKLQILFVSRVIVIGIAMTATLIAVHHAGHHTEKHKTLWVAGFVAIAYIVASWLQGLWNNVRYRQQEDTYYLLHDALRAKLESENKDYSEAQLRSLSAYQHQQRLRKADEEGKLLRVLREDASQLRKARPAAAAGSDTDLPSPAPEA